MTQPHQKSNSPLLMRRRRQTTGGIEKQGIESKNDHNKAVTRSMISPREMAMEKEDFDESTRSFSTGSNDPPDRDTLSSLPSIKGSSGASATSSQDRRQKTTISQEFQRASSQVPTVSNPRIQELTINKLKYDSVGLIGREQEVAALQECCNRAFQNNRRTKKELVLITGTSGVGKSRLTETVENRISASTKGIFGKGKFNLESSAHPYSGLVDALNQLYDQALVMARSTDVKEINQLKQDLSSELGNDVTLLAALIQGLETLAPAELLARNRSTLMQELYNPDSEQAQWKNAFKVFIRVLCQHCSPLVLIMEDLQWADRSSLDVMEDLLSDAFNEESLMIIGTFRSDEVDADNFLSTTIETLEKKKRKSILDITEIEPENLKLEDVHNIIMTLLGMDDHSATRGLAEICFKRTLGNPNFVLQFITLVEEEGLISFNLGLLKWVWDDKKIEAETMSTENVVDLLQLRMKKLSQDMRLLLQYAACLGASFDPSVLTLLWEKQGSSASSKSTIELLEKLVESNFLEIDGKQYRWVHDKVQEAALEMEEAQRPSFYFEVGSTLLNNLPDHKLEALLFVVTNLINKSNVRGRLEFAALNLRAAEKAQHLSAFYNGASYAAKAIELLPSGDEKWKENREMTLQAYTIAAEMEVATGNVDIAEEYCNVILDRHDYTALEKNRLYMVKLNMLLFVKVKFKEAIDFGLDVLKEFGFKLAPNPLLLPIHTIRSLKKTIKVAKKTTVAEYRSLKPSNDPRLEAIMTVLGRMNYACVQTKNGLLLALTTAKMANITLEHGLLSFSGAAHCILGMVCLAALGDVPSATFFAEMGALMQRSIPSKHFVATTMLVSYHVILPWSQPFGALRPQLRIGYLEGIRTGNLSDGIWCLVSYSIYLPLQMGMCLKTINANTQTLIRVVEDLKQADHVITMKNYRQAILDVMGGCDETTFRSGSSVASDDNANQKHTGEDATVKAGRSICTYFSLVFLGEYEEAASLSLTLGGVARSQFKGDPLGVFESFLRGVALFAMARKTKTRRYRKPAGKMLKFIAKQMKNGNPNVHHCFTLLSAERAALKKDKRQAEKLYQESIAYAARTGQLGHAALANERYSDYLFHEVQDKAEAKYHMDEAIKYYQDWGAQAKVDLLQGSSHFSM